MSSRQIRKNVNDLELSIFKYSDLLSNILNQQDISKNMLKKTSTYKSYQNSKQKPSNIGINKSSTKNLSSNSKTNLANKLTSPFNGNNSDNNFKSNAPKHHQSILKQKSSIPRPHTSLIFSNSKPQTSFNSNRSKLEPAKNSNLIQKSKSADNLNRSNPNKSISNLKKNDLNKSSSDFQIDSNLTKKLESFNQKLNIKPEKREIFISQLLNLIKNNQNEKNNNTTNANDELESKLDLMKSEIDKLKSKLVSNNMNPNQIVSSNSSSSNASSSSSSSIMFNSTEINPNINIKAPNYSDKLVYMQKQINELTQLNKTLLLNKSNNFSSINEENLAKVNEKNNDKNNLIIIENLEKKIKDSNERCKVLDYLLEQKTRENEQFSLLIKDIGEAVATLIKELEKNEKEKYTKNEGLTKTNKHNNDSVIESMSINNLKESLVNFQKKLNHQFPSKLVSQPTSVVINHLENSANRNENYFQNNLIKIPNHKIIVPNYNKSSENSATTSSDTLIDADSSFESNNLMQKNNLKLNRSINSRFDLEKCTINSATLKSLTNNLINNNNYCDSDDSNDDEENNYQYNDDGIVIALQDLTLSTMQTSDNEPSASNDSIANLNINDEDQFQEGLKMLDQKIFKVKKLLETMKNS